jgi:integrase
LFLKEDGEPLDYPAWQKVWRPTRKKAKTEMKTNDFRHFFASVLIAGGASVKQVQTVLGHQSPMITLRYYAHLWPGDEDRTRSVIDGKLDGLRTICGLEASEKGSTAGQAG